MSNSIDKKSSLALKSSWDHLSIEFTTLCNLRCAYCKGGASLKSATRDELSMDAKTAKNVMEAVKKLYFKEINFNGSGEFTTRPDWTSLIYDFPKASGQSLYLVSNFAKIFNDNELDALLHMDRVYISLDSANKGLLKILRPPVDIRTITYNLLKLKTRAFLLKRKMPFVRINCVVSNLNGIYLEELSAYCVYLGVDELEFFPLNISGKAEINGLRSFSNLSESEIQKIRKQIEKACHLLSEHNIRYRITDELKCILCEPQINNNRQHKKLGKCVEQGNDPKGIRSFRNKKIRLRPEPNKITRLCLQPWKRILIGANGQVYPCCRKSIVMGDLKERPLLEIIEDSPLISLRKALLSGKLKGTKCYNCANAPLVELKMLERKIIESARKIITSDKQELEASSYENKRPTYRVISPQRTVYYAQFDAGFIDYQTYSIEGIAPYGFRGPYPGRAIPKNYVSCLGAAQTFGRFVENPYPALLQQKIAEIPFLNLGLPGAGPAAYLLSPSIIDLVNEGSAAIIQVFSGRSASNRYFKSLGFSNGKRNSDGTAISALNAFKEIFEYYNHEQIEKIVEETTTNWLVDFKALLKRLRVPTILLWFSVKTPPKNHDFTSRESLFGAFPHLVTQEMLNELKINVNKFVEVITKKGLPHKIYSENGKEIEVMINNEMTYENRYYPSPEMHMDVADAIAPVIKMMI